MGAGPGSHPVAAGTGEIPWTRATLAWMVIMSLETAHGIVRNVFIAPAIGDLRARQWGVLVGSLLVLLVAAMLFRWMKANTPRVQFIIGGGWVALTVTFEIVLGRIMGASWSRILSDYNPAQGGFMILGLAVMFMAPWLVARWRT
jgi:hypothetical protein